MLRILQSVLVGISAFAALASNQPLHAQTTLDPIFFAGVVGDTDYLQTVQGEILFFSDPRPTFDSLFDQTFEYDISGGADPDDLISFIQVQPFEAPTEPTFVSWTLDYSTPDGNPGGLPVGTGDAYIVIFSTAEHRDAFLYYLLQRDSAATDTDYQYFNTLAGYEFWIGQENTSLALYSYYTGMASYLRDTASDPRQGMYNYWYYIGLGAYYYFEGIGDSESATLAWAYHYQLAVEALGGE